MNRIRESSWVALTALALSGAAALVSAADAAGTKDAKGAIEALNQRFAAAFNAKDVDAIMKLYAPGSQLFVFDVSPPREIVGWDNHRNDHPQVTQKDGSKHELVLRVTDVYRRIHGEWLIVQEHVSVPVDLATAQPDLMSKP